MKTQRFEWVPPALVVLGLVPMAAGLLRLGQLASGGPVTAENSRFFATPFPVIVHIVAASLYTLLGAFQFSNGLRVRWPRWHRLGGRVLTLCGLAAAVSGLWMAQFYPLTTNLQGPLLLTARYLVAVGMVASLVLGVATIRQRRVAEHQAWMMRAYGMGIGAGTQVLTALPWLLIVEEPTGWVRDLLLVAGWAINVVIVEIVLHARGRVGLGGQK